MAIWIIISILVIGLMLIATENINKMNKAAVAMFVGVICWLLYIGYGTQFVVSEHQIDFLSYISDNSVESSSVKEFIAESVFLKYIVRASEVVLFLLATMTIVEVLNNNGCFDFIQEWLRTRNPQRFLWLVSGLTFVLSANLDNLMTVCLMLSIVHAMIADTKQRMTFGAVVVIAANCGGAFTVIGDVTSLAFWTNGLISPTAYAAMAFLPSLLALLTILLLFSRSLPHRLDLMMSALPYRGDDTVLTRWQRLLMLLVGIGGLWFIPTFHRITLLPPFVGALCVLALLWIVNELCNRRLLGSDMMVRKRQPMALQYVNIQLILFFFGLTLAFGAVNETGILDDFFRWSTEKLQNVYIIGGLMGLASAIFNNVTTTLANITVFSPDIVGTHPELLQTFGENGLYWPLLSYTSSVGGSLLSIGTMAGYALMRTEDVTLRWYVRHVSGKVLAGWVVGFIAFYIAAEYFYL